MKSIDYLEFCVGGLSISNTKILIPNTDWFCIFIVKLALFKARKTYYYFSPLLSFQTYKKTVAMHDEWITSNKEIARLKLLKL